MIGIGMPISQSSPPLSMSDLLVYAFATAQSRICSISVLVLAACDRHTVSSLPPVAAQVKERGRREDQRVDAVDGMQSMALGRVEP